MALRFIQTDRQTFASMTKDPQTFYHVLSDTNIYGAEWNGSFGQSWTRTDAATGFSDPVPQMSDGNGGWTVGSSPFDYIYPWSKIRCVEDSDGGTLVAIPKFYYKWTYGINPNSYVDDDGDRYTIYGAATKVDCYETMKLQISAVKHDGFMTSPAHADRGDGHGERDVVYVGRYDCSSVDLKSTTGTDCVGGYPNTIVKLREDVHNLGSDIWMYDYSMFWTIAMLYLVEFAHWNSQQKIGYGVGGKRAIAGLTDNMTYHTGTAGTSKSEKNSVQYRYIENVWGNNSILVDGIYIATNYNVYAMKNPMDYSTRSNSVCVLPHQINYGSQWIRTFNHEDVSGFEYALIPSGKYKYGGGSGDNVFIGDGIMSSGSSSWISYFMMGRNVDSDSMGLFYYYPTSETTYNTGITARIQKLPS